MIKAHKTNLFRESENLKHIHTQIHGCFKASEAVILFEGLTVSIWLIRFFASGVTVSHSGEGYYKQKHE
jgi:hypothetical protein